METQSTLPVEGTHGTCHKHPGSPDFFPIAKTCTTTTTQVDADHHQLIPFLADFLGSGVSLRRISGGLSIEPFLGGGSGLRAVPTLPPPQLKARPPPVR